MKLLSFISVLAIGASSALVAAEVAPNESPMSSTLNADCPMCGKTVGEKPEKIKVTVGEGEKSKTYYIACDNKPCADELMKDPEPYMKKQFGKNAPGAKIAK